MNDSTSWTYTAWFTIPDNLHYFELDWKAARAAGANDGWLKLWIDGTYKAIISNFDNDTRRIERNQLGALSGIDNGTRSTYLFDAFEAHSESYIGPDPNAPTPPPPSKPDLIFENGFESGNFSAWSSSTTDGGDLSVTGGAALIGSYGMAALVDDTNSISTTVS